jgi:hypothetical protein
LASGHRTSHDIIVAASSQIDSVNRDLWARCIRNINDEVLKTKSGNIETRKTYKCIGRGGKCVGRSSIDESRGAITLDPSTGIKTAFDRDVARYVDGARYGIGSGSEPKHIIGCVGDR